MFKSNTTVKTRSGSKVEIVAVLDKPAAHGMQIVGVMTDRDGRRDIESWTIGGHYDDRGVVTCLDLVATRPQIATSHVYPPIPERQFDWCAWYDGDEPNDNGQMDRGWGATEAAAIADLTQHYPREEAEAA